VPAVAPLRVTVEIALRSGDAAGQRCFRISSQLELPPRLALDGALPIAGEGAARVRFAIPSLLGPEAAPCWIDADARLRFDPEHPERGAAAELLGLSAPALQRLETYAQERVPS
jgi:hypothetical protein